MLPSGESSSTRSMRCMGKKTTPEEAWIACFNHGDQVFERTQFDAGEAEPLSGQG